MESNDEYALYSYKMTHDTGFAPNPFGKTLTLATCKPKIRLCKKVGHWVAGFSSVALNRDRVGEERLIYLMHVGEKKAIRDYFYDPRFADKKPSMVTPGPIAKAGDNIYRPLVNNAEDPIEFEQIENPNHWDWDNKQNHWGTQKDDLSGKYVLIAKEFYYFGGDPLFIPDDLRPSVPIGQSAHGNLTQGVKAKQFIEFIQKHFEPGRHSWPTSWPEAGEETNCGSCR